MEEKDYKSKKEMLETGKFYAFNSLNAFAYVYQWFGGDKVKISAAPVGAKGQGADFYFDTDDFDILCDEILDGSLKTAFINSKKNDKGYYIPCYSMASGHNGSKKFSLTRGSKQPIVITVQDTEKKKTINVPVAEYRELKKMAKWWKRISYPYYSQLTAIGYKAEKAYKPK